MNHFNPPNLPPPSKKCPEIGSCSAWGALKNFPCKLRLNFFSSLDVQVHPLHPLAICLWEQEAPLPRRAQRVRRAQLVYQSPTSIASNYFDSLRKFSTTFRRRRNLFIFFYSDFKFFDDSSEFSATLYVVFFSSKNSRQFFFKSGFYRDQGYRQIINRVAVNL